MGLSIDELQAESTIDDTDILHLRKITSLDRKITYTNLLTQLIASLQAVDTWHEVGAVDEPVFENSWVNFGAGYYDLSFFKDALGWVHIRGMVKLGTVGTIIFTLPAGYRSSGNIQVPTVCNDLFGSLFINTLGEVYHNTGSNAWCTITDVTFLAEN